MVVQITRTSANYEAVALPENRVIVYRRQHQYSKNFRSHNVVQTVVVCGHHP